MHENIIFHSCYYTLAEEATESWGTTDKKLRFYIVKIEFLWKNSRGVMSPGPPASFFPLLMLLL